MQRGSLMASQINQLKKDTEKIENKMTGPAFLSLKSTYGKW